MMIGLTYTSQIQNDPSGSTYRIGDPGIYFVKGLFNDPVNDNLAYLFVTDKNLNQGTFGVFKLNFDPPDFKYFYTILSMSSGSTFSVNTIRKTSQTDANDFFFAGKAQILTDGINSKIFPTATGYLMKGKTSDSTKNCFSFPSGYSLSL